MVQQNPGLTFYEFPSGRISGKKMGKKSPVEFDGLLSGSGINPSLSGLIKSHCIPIDIHHYDSPIHVTYHYVSLYIMFIHCTSLYIIMYHYIYIIIHQFVSLHVVIYYHHSNGEKNRNIGTSYWGSNLQQIRLFKIFQVMFKILKKAHLPDN